MGGYNVCKGFRQPPLHERPVMTTGGGSATKQAIKYDVVSSLAYECCQ